MKPKTVAIRCATFLCALLVACSALGIGVTRIGDIVANPSRFNGTEVRVKGKVVNVNKLPLVDLRIYTLRDDSGEITVVAGEKLPALGGSLVVRARVDAAAIIQGEAVGLRLTELETTPTF